MKKYTSKNKVMLKVLEWTTILFLIIYYNLNVQLFENITGTKNMSRSHQNAIGNNNTKKLYDTRVQLELLKENNNEKQNEKLHK